MLPIDPVGVAIRLCGPVAPRLRARFDLARQRRGGDSAIHIVEELVSPGAIAVDVGARWGTYTRLLIRLVGQRGAVHVFEPNPEHARALRAISRKGRKAHFHPFALSDESGRAELHIPELGGKPADGLASLIRPRAVHDTAQVERRRLDDLRLGRVDFIKCDVEGHELAVFRGAEETLRRFRPAVLVEIEQRHGGADVAGTLALFERLGYVAYAIYEDGLRPASEFSIERDQLRPLELASATGWMMPLEYVHDFLFVRPGTALRNLIAAQPR